MQQIPADLEIHRVLFATDFSPASAEAARVARAYARRFGAELHVVHAVPPGEGDEPLAELDRVAGELAAGAPVVAACMRGQPADAIIGYALRHAIDLVVVGTHGRTGRTRALLGSVAERVTRLSPCPVLTVPAASRAAAGSSLARASEPPPSLRRCVVCAAPGDELICEPCRARIRGEALDRWMQRIEP
jgi:nucleotide-binding universal stress UspA family protein